MKSLGKLAVLFASLIFFLAVSVFPQGIVGTIGTLHSISNAPYSATQETVETRTLSNGVHVVTKNHVNLYRDSAGRTRREMFNSEGMPFSTDGPFAILIVDPVAGAIYNLDPRNHTAQITDVTRSIPVTPLAEPPRPAEVPGTRPAVNRTPPIVTEEDLGTEIIDGLEAQGRRTTRTIPTGTRGNDGPIVITSESWNSVGLHLTLLQKNSDPSSGESVVRIANLDRSEPDPALFQVPADYAITNHPDGN